MQFKKIKRNILPLMLTACTVFLTVPAQAANVPCKSAKDAYQKAAVYVMNGNLSGGHSKRFVYKFNKKKSKEANIRMLYHAKYTDDGLHTWGDYIRMELEAYPSYQNTARAYDFLGSYQLYWYTNKVSDMSGSVTVKPHTAYKANKERAFVKAAKKKAKAITRNKKGDVAKTRAIYNWVIKHVSYDNNYKKRFAYEAYYNKKAVCQGYANLMYVMCRDAGIPCRLAYNAKMNHEWVLVKINKKWYQCDPTWGDTTKKPNTYFLRGASMKGHRKPVSFTSCKLPKISKKAYYH